MAGVKGRFSEDRDRLDALMSRPVVASTTLSADQREAAFIKLLAEAIASDIKRGGAATRESLDEPDEKISATISCEVAVARKAGEADGGLLSHGHPHKSATAPLRSPGSRSPTTAITIFNKKRKL